MITLKTSKKIMLFGSAAAFCTSAWAAASYALTRKMVKIAINREKPNTSKKSAIRLSGTPESEYSAQIEEASIKLKQSVTQTINIQASDGENLAGHIYHSKNPKRIIIAMHGWRSSWNRDFGPISDFWMQNDCTILYADQRGQNKSGGNYIGFGLVERFDCRDWALWVNDNINPGKLPIYFAGISMGATTVLMAAGLELPHNVCGIMADCGFTSPYAIFKHVADNNLKISYVLISALANSMYKKRIEMNTDDYSTIEALSHTNIPVLLIHGSDDRFVPVEMTYENYKACNSPKKILIVPGATHALSYYVNTRDYQNAVCEFWNQFDNKKAM